MNIKEYWARLVAAGLAPDFDGIENVIATYDGEYWAIQIYNNTDLLYVYRANNYNIESGENIGDEIQLRKDGVDLYKLEWRKPTEINKECWFWHKNSNSIIKSKLWNCYIDQFGNFTEGFQIENFYHEIDYCLLADHGQIAPTEQDFIEVYNEV